MRHNRDLDAESRLYEFGALLLEHLEPAQVFVVVARVGAARERLKGGRSEYSLGTVYSPRHACLVQ